MDHAVALVESYFREISGRNQLIESIRITSIISADGARELRLKPGE